MIESALMLVDKLIALVRVKGENKRNKFKDFIEPLFVDVEKAFDDYLHFLNHLRTVVKSKGSNPSPQDMDQILTDRDQYRVLRLKIRALAEAYSSELLCDDDTYDFFNKTSALFAPIPGDPESLGNSYAMFTPMSAAHNMFTELLNLIPYLREQEIERVKRQSFDDQVAKLIRESETKWQEICTCYSVLRTKYLAAL